MGENCLIGKSIIKYVDYSEKYFCDSNFSVVKCSYIYYGVGTVISLN